MPKLFLWAGGHWLLAIAVCGCVSARAEPDRQRTYYDVLYEVDVRSDCVARVGIHIDRNPGRLIKLRIQVDPERQFGFEGDGTVEAKKNQVVWNIPEGTAKLRYRVRLDHQRDSGEYDARCTEGWAMFRGEDLFPPTAAASPDGLPLAYAKAILRFKAPKDWSIVTPFPKGDHAGEFIIDQPHRFHDRPTGWIITGKLVVLREKYQGVSLIIASPINEGVRRLDMLALLRWTLPKLKKIVPELPERLLIVSAGDPMWRGALSGPSSVYIHAERPLIWRDATSPLLHELIHVVTHAKSAEDGDWVVEGMAEYYALELLRRSRGISKKRYKKAHQRLEKKGRKAKKLLVEHASGAVTARAVAVMRRLDELLRKETKDRASLDDLLYMLQKEHTGVTTVSFRKMAEQVAGRDLENFFRVYVYAK
ncbi:MAG: hypothetical protein ABFS02_03160 [Pseudomonadota bacterium]